ncbi:hypothetical protein ACFIJ5_16210 [Haloimpatiens sp. FM7330]|uniref:hypothetical protein n=1 Tax=Haloimpatiens sp. FM7330 TaxID=3298610 RepID=UPI00363F55E0
MIINKNNLEKLQKLSLHDSEFNEIRTVYDENTIVIPINHYYFRTKAILRFLDVLYCEITLNKLWGYDNYIFSCELNEEDIILEELKRLHYNESKKEFIVRSKLREYQSLDEFFSLTLLLHSGDKIKIITRQIVLEKVIKQ